MTQSLPATKSSSKCHWMYCWVRCSVPKQIYIALLPYVLVWLGTQLLLSGTTPVGSILVWHRFTHYWACFEINALHLLRTKSSGKKSNMISSMFSAIAKWHHQILDLLQIFPAQAATSSFSTCHVEIRYGRKVVLDYLIWPSDTFIIYYVKKLRLS